MSPSTAGDVAGGPSPDRARPEDAGGGDRVAHRVRLSHAQSRSTITIALAFVLAAAIAAAAGGSTWLALHLFLAGGVTLTVSAVSLMLTVTWAAAPAPSDRFVAIQRWSVAIGAAGVAFTRETASVPDRATGVPGVVYLGGLLLLVVLLITTARQGRERRFDVAVAFYACALAAAITAVGVGVHMAVTSVTLQARSIHVVLNLLGFVGLTIAGSLPFFAATVGRSRMSRSATPLRLGTLLGAMVLSLGAMVAGLAADVDGVVFTGLGGYAYGIVAVYCFAPRPDRRQLSWSGPRLVALWVGGLWWVGAVAAMAVGVITDDHDVLIDRWMLVLVVGGYAQILWGSLAYLLPVLRGGGGRTLREGFDRTRSWIGFGGINAAAVALALEEPGVAIGCLAVTVGDGAWRAGRIGLRPSTRPGDGTRAPAAPPPPAT